MDSRFGDCGQYSGGANGKTFGFAATLGNIVYATSFLITDILSENYGKRKPKGGVDWLFQSDFHDAAYESGAPFKPLEETISHLSTHEATGTIFKLMPRLHLQAGCIPAFATPRCVGISFLERALQQGKSALDAHNFSTMVSHRLTVRFVHRFLRRV